MANKGYFGLSKTISLILAIIPFTAAICGIITRFMEEKKTAALVRLVVDLTGVGTVVLWLLDLYTMVTKEEIFAFQEYL